MKHRFRIIINGVITTYLIMIVCGCSEQEMVNTSSSFTETQIAESFDYKTTFQCGVKLQYAGKNLVTIYDTDPSKEANAVQLYSAYTNENGEWEGKAVLPSSLIGKTVYACTETNGKKVIVETQVSVGGIYVHAPLTKRNLSTETEILYTDLVENLLKELPEGEDNSNKVMVDQQELRMLKDAEVEIILLRSENEMGKELKYSYSYSIRLLPETYKFIISGGNSHTGSNPVSLTFWDQKDVKELNGIYTMFNSTENAGSSKFLKRYYEGSYLYTYTYSSALSQMIPMDAYRREERSMTTFAAGQTITFSLQDAKVVCFRGSNSNVLVYGFESTPLDDPNCDKDYNDVLVMIKTTPSDAISVEGFPIVEGDPKAPEEDGDDEPQGPEYGTDIKQGSLLFEDTYPWGDYDMNDLIIEYKYIKHFDDENHLKKVTIEYAPVWNGGVVSKGLYMNIVGCAENPVHLPNTSIPWSLTNDKFIKQSYSKEISIQADNKDDLTWDLFDPFLKVGVNTGRREVHLPKMFPTEDANVEGLTELQKRFLSSDIVPYAMDIPIWNFRPSPEKTKITVSYPKFEEWVKSKGTTATDWYLK